MTLSLSLPPDVEAKLRERAARDGQSVDAYATKLLAESVSTPRLDEILAPFRKEIADSGMSDEQLDQFYEALRDEAERFPRSDS